MKGFSKHWWTTDSYESDHLLHPFMEWQAGPNGPAFVRVYDHGDAVYTQPGWGEKGAIKDGRQLPGFMENYKKNKFHLKTAQFAYERKQQPQALVMRSVRFVCIDIDGKNGGLTGIKQLGVLPETLAETSKSGNGYHLFYRLPEHWDDEKGYGSFPDVIGIVPGVDIRSVGCVYHYPQQRWNDRALVDVPKHVLDKLTVRQRRSERQRETIVMAVQGATEDEILVAQQAIVDDLNKDIPEGRRNNTLFAIGQQLREAGVESWDVLIQDRAAELGLSAEEADTLVGNIEKY